MKTDEMVAVVDLGLMIEDADTDYSGTNSVDTQAINFRAARFN